MDRMNEAIAAGLSSRWTDFAITAVSTFVAEASPTAPLGATPSTSSSASQVSQRAPDAAGGKGVVKHSKTQL